MKRKVCEYCGTEYNIELQQCPLCGRSDAQEKTVEKKQAAVKAGARVAPRGSKKAARRSQDSVPQWMWVLICAILTVAVLIGFIYFLVSMGYLGSKEPVEPVTPPAAEEQLQPEQEEPVVEEPEDLSCQELTLSQYSLLLDEQGGHVFLTALPTPLECEDPIVFTSEDEEIATVDEGGMITAVAPGQTQIVVTCGDVTEECLVICDFVVEEEPVDETEEPPSEETDVPEETEEPDPVPEEPAAQPELSSVDFTLFRPGEETTLLVKNAPEGAVITYTSSNTAVVTVTDTGLVTAVGNGNATITVMVNDVKLSCIARCNLGQTTENNEPDESVAEAVYSLSHVDVTFFATGESFVLSLKDTDGNKAEGASFASSNTSVCTVDGNGRVTAVEKGTANVTVTHRGTTYTCIVRCNF